MATAQNNPTNQPSPDHYIQVRGARQHNLRNIDLDIPKNKLVVFTGLSGSGKSSLVFDTIFAEGQRRYVESLSSYARQFLGVMSKPDVDQITGLSPAIAIDQKTTSKNPRSTVGTITEIYDYLRLLFARVGHPHCPDCDLEIQKLGVDQIVQHITDEIRERAESHPIVRVMVLAPIVRDKKGEFQGLFKNLRKQGFARVLVDNKMYSTDDDVILLKNNKHTIEAVLDRFAFASKTLKDQKTFDQDRRRLTQAVEQALQTTDGLITIAYVLDASLSFPESPTNIERKTFSEKFMCPQCGMSLSEIEPRIFSFNTPHGACPECHGLGHLLKIDPHKIIAPSLTLPQGAIVPIVRMFEHNTWYSRLLNTVIDAYGSTMNTPYSEYSEELQHVLLYGDKKVYTVVGTNKQERETTIHETFTGVIHELEHRYTETESDFVRQELERYMTKEVCPVCNGQRLKPESLSVTIDRKNIAQISGLQISHALSWVEMLHEAVFSDREKQIAESIVKEIIERLRFLSAVGLNYLTLSREAETLAGGEAQRIRLASQIGTGLTGVLYVLDEPTIGLHQRDNQRLLATLKRLRDLGNSVLVVEHDQETIEAADYVFDFGPKAGQFGGEIVAQGSVKDLCQNPHSLTGAYIKGKMVVSLDKKKRDNLGDEIVIKGASAHNLKHIDTEIPLGKLVCITGVSGSGKSTLLFDSLYLNAARQLGYVIHEQPGAIDRIDIPSRVKRLTFIDQSPIGKTPRSNPATYTKVFDMIRELYAGTSDAHGMGYSAGRFSFNVKGGRCEACSGEGQVKIEMQFLPDMYVTCDVCHGTRYNSETLHILYRDKSIADVLAMTIDEAIEFFKMAGRIRGKLQTLQDVGLGYIHLGQAAPTLSGGEAQRVKLARELSTRISEHTLYLLDEPTTGLHFADVQKLLEVLNRLVEANNTVVLIEHNLDVIRNADWIIDLGPEGGEEGGEVVAVGDAAHVKASPRSVTGGFV